MRGGLRRSRFQVSDPRYILVLVRLLGNPAEPHTTLREFATEEQCRAAAQELAAPGVVLDCVPVPKRRPEHGGARIQALE
jgi:hypothetical protein